MPSGTRRRELRSSGIELASEATREAHEAILRVSDSGPGVPADALTKTVPALLSASMTRVGVTPAELGSAWRSLSGQCDSMAGKLRHYNRDGKGLVVEIRLPLISAGRCEGRAGPSG